MPAAKPQPWKKLSSTTLLTHPRITVAEDEVELPDGKTSKYIHLIDTKDAVMVIAVRNNGDVLIQQEYSYPPNEVMYQFPGGAVEPDETPEQGALRELKEESGYRGETTYLGFFYSNNRRTSSKMHVYLVTNVEECPKEGGDTEEFITSEWVPLAKLRTMIADGEIVNFSILAGMSLYDAKNTTYNKNHRA
jgi:ADP-ribose pyrophosphatase